jgi:hypothetical protein
VIDRADPADTYQARLQLRRGTAEQRAKQQRWLSNGRLAVFAVLVALCFLVLGPTQLTAWTLAPPALGFAVLVWLHDRVIRARRRAERAVLYFEAGLARLEPRFSEGVSAGERFRDPVHVYAEDLDLFGPTSLFALLCRARTPMGEAKLAGWLLAPAAPAEIRSRQGAIAELAGRIDLREQLCLVGEELAPRLHPEALREFAEAESRGPSRLERGAALGLAFLSVATLGVWILLSAGPLPWLATLTLLAAFTWLRRSRVRACVRALERVGRDLDVLAELLACVEAEPFDDERLRHLQRGIETRGVPASAEIARLRRLRDLLDARRNQFFAPLGASVGFTTQVVFAIEAWRSRCGSGLPGWLDTLAEIEALASLGTQAFEQPQDVFPEVVESGPRFEAEGLGHPLLSATRCVRNDLALSPERGLFVVSGSNMSGKSTLLRSVGVNAILALSGAPVRAHRLVISALAVGASIQVHDSLLEGASRFYAEITRLQHIVAACDAGTPVLFLLDEILHGTNSHDRRIGAEAVVKALGGRGAIGLVTTHDLALAAIAEALGERAANVHFEDRLVEGRVRFDYRLHPGVVTHSNALDLMRAVGLEV